MKKIFASLLTILGYIFFLIAFMSVYYSVTSLIEMSDYGVPFSNVEIYIGLTLFFILIGFLFIRISNKIKKGLPLKK